MSSDMKISGPVNVQSSSDTSTALELMKHIGKYEDSKGKYGDPLDREYWLELYAQCRKVVKGGTPVKEIL